MLCRVCTRLVSMPFWVLAICVLPTVAARTVLAAPVVNNASIRGLSVGGVTTITFDGADLLPEPRILATFPISKQTVLPGASATRVQIEVTLDESVPHGIYDLRLANAKGISNPMAFGLDRLPQLLFVPEIEALPVALHGAVNGSEMRRAVFRGKKDERVLIDVESRRLGANLKPVVRVYDERGRQIAWSPQLLAISGDARCEVVLPADGLYTVELHDLLYRAAAPGFFRLKIGALTFADLALPLGVSPGQKTAIELAATNLPAGAKVELEAEANVLFPLDRPVLAGGSANFTGAAPRVFISGHAEVLETVPPQGQLQTIEQAPVGISGRIAAEGEEDRYLLAVAPGAKLRFDVQARRLGSPLDGVLSVRGEKGEQPASNDDRPGIADPGLDYTVPQGVNKLVVSLRDLQHRGGPDFVYRISVADLTNPNFSLALEFDRVNIPAGGAGVLEVRVERGGYNGPLRLEAHGLPSFVRLAGQEIPAGATLGLLSFSAPAGESFAGLCTIVGVAADGSAPAARAARLPDARPRGQEMWLNADLGVATAEAAPLNLVWEPGTTEETLLLGGKLAAKASVTRAEGVAGQVRLKLRTTQIMPKKKIKENNQDKEVDDLDRALRLEGTPLLAADANESVANILVPADLASAPWSLVLVAELLSADGKNVVATAAAPTRTLAAKNPLALELSSAPNIEARAGGGETGKLTGKIVRVSGFQHAVTISLAGLPNGIASPTLEVPADQEMFSLPVSFAAGAKTGELKGVTLVATAVTDPKLPNHVARSNAVPVAINVVPGE